MGTSMFAVIGILVVLGAVIGGFLMEQGQCACSFNRRSLLIIGGAAIGYAAGRQSAAHAEGNCRRRAAGVSKGSRFNKQRYLDSLKMMYHVQQD